MRTAIHSNDHSSHRATGYFAIACTVFLLMVMLAGCATPPPKSSTFYYRGVYAPGEATIAADGSFVSTSKVAEADQLGIASEAAMLRLVRAAEERGLRYVVLDAVHNDIKNGYGYRIEGNLFDASNAPEGAVAISEIAAVLAQRLLCEGEDCGTQPAFAVPAKQEKGAPTVINAPDFVS